MSAETIAPPSPAQTRPSAHSRPAARLRSVRTHHAVFAAFAACVASQFATQAYLTYGFAADIWHLPEPLRWGQIAALDTFAVITMILTYLMRTAKFWGPRGAAWLAFAFAVGTQCYVAEAFAAHEGWPLSARWLSAFPSVALAVSLEMVSQYRRHLQRAETPPPVAAPRRARPPAATAEQTSTGDRTSASGGTVTAIAAGRKRRRQTRADDDPVVAECRRRVADGEECRVVGPALGRSRRWAEVRTKDIRAAQSVIKSGPGISGRKISPAPSTP